MHANVSFVTAQCATHPRLLPRKLLSRELQAQGASCFANPTAFLQHPPCPPHATSRSAQLTCRAAASSAPAYEDPASIQIPESREKAVEQACTAIAAQLTGSKKVKSKGFSGSGSTKFSVEIPVADNSLAASLALASDIVQRLPAQLRSQFTIVSAAPTDDSQPGSPILSLQQCLQDSRQLSGCLLIVGATKQQIADVSRLLACWRGPGAVLLNADWWADDNLPEDHIAFAATFEAIYSFVPLEIKAFVTTQQGAVFKWVRSGSAASAPWRIFALEGKSWASVGRMQRRPTSGDIESAFYNASAAKSPVTQGISFLKGLVPGQKKQ